MPCAQCTRPGGSARQAPPTRRCQASARTTRGGQPSYSDLAIATALTVRAVFRLAPRRTGGLIGSILALLGLDLAVPDHSTLRACLSGLNLRRLGLAWG